jgi:gliding motility-associated-like protein
MSVHLIERLRYLNEHKKQMRLNVVISKCMWLIRIILILFALPASGLMAQVWMVPNRGQWDNRILYNVELSGGNMIIERNGFTFSLSNIKQVVHHPHEVEEHSEDQLIHCHTIRSRFIGSDWKGKKLEADSSSFYSNYILGKDQTRWKSGVRSFQKVEMQELYPGVSLILNGHREQLEYTLEILPGADASIISQEISGSDRIWIDDQGMLHIAHRFGEIVQSAPVAWIEKDGRKKEVECQFELTDSVLSFRVGNYDRSAKLIIDPSLTFSTFTGSIADNWGFTAAPDPLGNMFAGGIVFGTGYPLTTGAYDVTFNGGTGTFPMDIGITKFNANGNALIYSTYIGGSGNETPNSIVTAPNGELFIYGVTSSANFPMAGSPYDPSYNGGPSVTENNLNFEGADIFVARLNPAGTALIASTYVGGSNTDGLNINTLQYNYGDQFRGEIILDDAMNVYVSSTTQSINFPVVGGMQGSINGTQDAVVFKMPPALNALTWSTFFGGSGFDTGNSVQLSSAGDVYFAGGTTSASLPITVGNDLTANGGLADGFVVRLNGMNGSFLSGTFMGYGEYDQAYFVQLDVDDKVYVLGQSQTSWPITAGLYGNPNSGQFIQKYSSDLSTIEWTTMIGAGTGNVEISPTAFLVSDCYEIYLSGWGGVLNQNTSVSQATFSTTNGFPVTPDAFQASTNGSNFYIAVLTEDAAALEYATFMGGMNSSSNHVDGGTSRFDKSGRMYHAVCGACGGNDFGFTSTPGSWSPANPSSNCNLAAFKFELNEIEAIISEPEPLICLPDPVVFNNNSANGNTFNWDFGDGTTSDEVNPVHFYTGPGDYTVTLVVSDSNGCFTPDSVTFVVHIGDFQGGVVLPQDPICPGASYQLEAYGGAQYEWSPTQFLDDPTSPTPYAVIDETTTFTVVVSDSCGIDTLQLTLQVIPFDPLISNDTSVCIGNSAFLSVSQGDLFNWTPAATLNDPTIQNPVATPDVSTTYIVEVESAEGCTFTDSVRVDVYYDPPIPVMPDLVTVCSGSAVTVTVSGGESYQWSPDQNISATTGSTVILSPSADMYYYCDFFNACGYATDSVFVDVITANISAGNDTTICPGETATLWAEGGVSYSWTPASSVIGSPTGSTITVRPSSPTVYTVVGTDATGCTASAEVIVDLHPVPFIQTSPDVYAWYGDVITLTANSSTEGTYIWSPAELVSCVSCQSTVTSPDQNTTIYVSYTDVNGCSASDSVNIYYDPIIWVPNTFTPDGDEFNNEFRVIGSNIYQFELLIFDRWGELLYTITSFDDYWDGTYKGMMCQDGTYTWKLTYMGYETDEVFLLTGHVNLLR